MTYTRLLILSLMALPAAAAAAEPDAESVADALSARWFETEVIVFERPGVGDEIDGEVLTRQAPRSWQRALLQLGSDATPESRYPFLLTEETRAQSARLTLGQARGRPNSDAGAAERARRRAEQQRRRGADATAAAQESELLKDDPTQEQAQEQEQPGAAELLAGALADFERELTARQLYELPPTALEDARERLERGNRHHILLHQRWLQAVPPRGEELPILVQAGGFDGERFELEGTLGVGIGRFLHLHAHLWLEPFGARQAQEAEAVAVDRAPGTTIENRFSVAIPEEDLSIDASGSALQQTVDGNAPVAPVAPEGPAYFEINERRRMRSGELHYIDHPRFGVLVKIEPVAIPTALIEAQAAAEAEAKAEAAQRRRR